MAQAVYQIDEYVAKVRKKDTLWIVFNKVYNDVHAFKKELKNHDDYLNEKETDYKAQKEFLEFMAEKLPDIKIEKIFDLVSAEFMIYPYLGSYVIDTDIGSEAYKVLSEKYGDPYKEPKSNRAVLWILPYEDAKRFYKDKKRLNIKSD